MVARNIVTDYSAVPDGQQITTTITVVGTALTITSGLTPFVSGDVGKYIAITGCGSGVNGNNPQNTFLCAISSFTDSQHITLSSAVSTNISSSTNETVEWGTDNDPFFTSFNTANQGTTPVTLTIPTGRYCIVGASVGTTIPNSGGAANVARSNLFTFGVQNLIVSGQGTAVISDMLAGGNGVFMGGANLAFPGNNTSYANTLSVSAGATKLILKNISDISLFSANSWAMMSGYDTQGFGYPTNCAFYEYVYITATHTGSGGDPSYVTISTPLKYTYSASWPNWGAGSAFAEYLGGPATLYQIAPTLGNWDCDHYYNNLTLESTYTVLNCIGRNINFNTCSFPYFGPNPTQTKDFSIFNSSVSSQWEFDKCIGTININGGTFRGFNVQSMTPRNCIINNATITNRLDSTPLNLNMSNSSYTNVASPTSMGPTSYGCDDTVSFYNVNFSNEVSFQGVGENDIFGAAGYTYAGGGIIKRARTAGTGEPPQWAIPGKWCTWGSGDTFQGTFFIDSIVYDSAASIIYIHTSLTSQPNPVGLATAIVFTTHPAPIFTCSGCSGSESAVAFSAVAPNQPYGSSWKRTYTGNIGTTLPLVPVFGKVKNIKFTVNSAYSAGTFNLTGPFVLDRTTNPYTRTVWNPSIDLTTTGVRNVTLGGANPALGTDSGLVLPSNDVWIVNGQIQPAMSGITGSGNITLEINLDQGIGAQAPNTTTLNLVPQIIC